MLHLPCYISSGLLGLLLVIQYLQHQKTVRGLIDKILETRGLDPLPNEHPLVKAVQDFTKKEPKEEKRTVNRIKFPIPGMPNFGEK